MKRQNDTNDANKLTLGQKLAKKNSWITWVAFAFIIIAVVISFIQKH
jgi:LPS O-antigen subunit length determinant protein (WzzB/FepE family)